MLKRVMLSTLSIVSISATANTAQICNDCGIVSKAEQYAKSQANPLECSPTFGQDISCSSRNKIVTFVDRGSSQVYKYNVYHQNSAPWTLIAEPMSLTADESTAFAELMNLYRAYANSINQASGVIQEFNSFSGQVPASVTGDSSSAAGTSCPENTALSTLLNPNKLEDIRTEATVRIGANMLSPLESSNLNPTAQNNSFGATYKGLSYTIQEVGANRTPLFVVGFDQTERETSISDYLAFSVAIFGYDPQGLPILDFTLSDSSRVAGYSLGALKGENGPLEIDNSCIEERLDEAVGQGILTTSSTTVGSGGGGTPTGGSEGGGDTEAPNGIGSSCQIVEFSQGGVRLYTFRICN